MPLTEPSATSPPSRGAATRGQVARTVSGVNAIEVKATIPHSQVDGALARYNLTVDNDQERYIYFFDTREQDLLKAGVIARARRIVGSQHDSTVKFRPVVPSMVSADWSRFEGFKLEADASEKDVIRSASLTFPVAKGLIKQVAGGKSGIATLFSKKQSKFLTSIGGQSVDFDKLTVFGPLQAHRWRFNDPACPWPVTAELWRRQDGAQLMEVSIKLPATQAAVAVAGFMAFLAEVGAEADTEQQAKTRWAFAGSSIQTEAAASVATAVDLKPSD